VFTRRSDGEAEGIRNLRSRSASRYADLRRPWVLHRERDELPMAGVHRRSYFWGHQPDSAQRHRSVHGPAVLLRRSEVPMSDVVSVTIADGIADVRLNRPEAMNAFNDDLFEDLIEVGQALRSDRGLRAVILSGEGRGFCAGLDKSSFAAQASGAALIPASSDGDPN